MIKFLWLTDVPTPYRNHSFERMAAIFPSMGIDFEVAFMALGSKRRPWSYASSDLHFPHHAFRGAHPLVRGAEIHVNPGILVHLRRLAPDLVMIGGWASPTHLSAPWCASKRTIRILGCESNLESVANTSTIASWIKARTIDRYDAFLVPQRRSLELIHSLNPASASKPHVVFPNIIDSSVFRAGVAASRRRDARASLGVDAKKQLWLCPARLAPEKGLMEFLPLLDLADITLLVAGDGPLRSQLEQLVRDRRLPVRFVGQQTEAQMIDLYASADLFVLPSLRDPSPLSVVESCAAGLPLFVSNRLGNVEDVLVSGENGFAYDANDPASNAPLVRQIASLARTRLAEMGAHSTELYEERFDSDTCVKRLGAALLEFHRRLH